MVETKEVYFNDRPPETRFYWHASLCITAWSNIRIFEDKSRIRLDKPMDTYGLTNPRFIIEYSNIRIRPSQNALHWIILDRPLDLWPPAMVFSGAGFGCIRSTLDI